MLSYVEDYEQIEKRCSKCGDWWPADLEFFHRSNGNGLNSWCKACCSERKAERYQENKLARSLR